MLRTLRHVVVASSVLALGGCFKADKDVSSYLARSRSFQADGDTAKARIELRSALAKDAKNPEANLALAKLEEAAGNLQEAVPYYARAAVPDAHLIEPQLRVAELLMDTNQLQEAMGRINGTLGSFPGNADALALRADLEQLQGKPGPAKTDVDAALRRDATNARALAVSAMLQSRGSDSQAALATVDNGLAAHPDNLRLLQVRAAVLMTLNQPENAADALRSIVRATPRNVDAQRALAELEARNGHFDAGLNNLKTAVAADPSNQTMQMALIGFLMGQKKVNDVIGYLNQLIESNPEENSYDLALAELYRSRGDLAQSKVVLERAQLRLGDRPASLDAKVAAAKIEIATGQLGLADIRLQNVLAVDPGHKEALLTGAVLALDNGRIVDAITNALTVVRKDPVSGRAFQILATAYMENGQPKLALDAMKRSVAVLPSDFDVQQRLAVFLQNGGAIDEARDLMTRLTLQRPDSPEVWAGNARLAIERKDFATASRSLARLQKLSGASDLALSLEGDLALAKDDPASAAVAYKKVMDDQADAGPDIIGAFARASARAGQAASAAQLLQQRAASLQGPRLSAAWLSAMTLWADAKQFSNSAEAFKSLVRVAPQEIVPYRAYANILVAQKLFDQAKAVVASGIAAGAPQWSMLLIRGAVNEAEGDLIAARASYKEALKNNPLSIEAANNYAGMLADQEPKNIAALEEARNLLSGSASSNNPLLIDTIAWLDYRLGRIDEAKALLTRINASTSEVAQLRFHMAAVLLTSGDRPRGLALLETVKGLHFPGSDEARSLSAT